VRAQVVGCDVSDAAQCAALVERAVAEFGRLDIFVNNAGIGFMMKPLLEVVPEDWDLVLRVNLSGAFYCTQAAARAMIAAAAADGSSTSPARRRRPGSPICPPMSAPSMAWSA
jgi:meso-butanediol dehydrogenase/(S,S)-butanediol dehydrogenase/diacetyl reductase